MTPDESDRLVAYHDTVCPLGESCLDDISTYPTPPDDWEAPA